MKTNEATVGLTQPGRFVVGCNYWASHAGTAMWSDWQPDVIDADLRQLAEAGLQVLRVFPLWPDFQPITQLYTGAGRPMEIRHGETPLPDDEAGRAGVSTEAMARFLAFADMAERHGLKLIVGLVTGWMSGRLFVPPALEGRNVLTDPVAIMWQVRLVRHFVRSFRGHPAVLAWDLGNECNCMAPAPSHAAAWTWTAAITNAIRAEDGTRPVVSGMHGLDEPDRARASWTIGDQAELTDVLTTHPYPYFTPHTDQDPVNTIRTALHATSQTRWYGDCGGRPALTEEIGTLGPMVASERIAADFARNVLFSLWAHDCHGLLWWCAYDQGHLTHPPYDWHAFERELGLFRGDRSAKPVLDELSRFASFLRELPIPALPPRLTEAVCILTHEQEQWAAAYSSFVLAKQAGFDLTFQYDDQPLNPARLYLVPSVSGGGSMSRRTWLALLERVRNGATLYLSHNNCMLSPFGEAFGLEVQTRAHWEGPAVFRLNGVEAAFSLKAPIRLALRPTHAEVLGSEPNGNPIFTRARYGQGQVYFLNVPIETHLANQPGGFDAQAAQPPWWRIYRAIGEPFLGERTVRKSDPFVGITEHPVDDGRRVVVAINYSPEPREVSLEIAAPWAVGETWYASAPERSPEGRRLWLGANDAAVFTLERR
jgi:hypothetical protein